MRVHLLAPFLLPMRPRLHMIFRPSDGRRAGSGGADGSVFIENHRSTGGARMDSVLWKGSLDAALPMACRSQAEVYVDPRGVGVLKIFCLVDRFEEIAALEREIACLINPLLPSWCERRVDRRSRASLEPVPADSMEASRILWWHRVINGLPPGSEPETVTTFGESARLDGRSTAVVGNGYTVFDDTAHEGDLLEGIVAATIDWLVIDDANRSLAGALFELSEITHGAFPYDTVLSLERRVNLLLLLRDEEARYRANGVANVVDAARSAWRMDAEDHALARRVQSIRDFTHAWQQREDGRIAERRERFIYALTVVVGLQGLLAVFDFVTNDKSQVVSTLRLWMGLAFTGVALAMVIGQIIRPSRRPKDS